jgi:hypothetical protein
MMTFMSETGSSGYAPGPLRASVPLRMTPARWVVLALTLPVAIALIGWTGFDLVSLVARGNYSFSYPVVVHNGQLNVNVNGDNVTMRQAPGAAARLTGSVSYGLFRPGLTEITTASGTTVGVNCDAVASNCDANDTLDVPTGTAVTLSTGGGDTTASGLAGTVKLNTEGGNVSTSNMTGNLQFYTGGGDLTGNGLNSGSSGSLLFNTDGGNVNASSLTGTMQIFTGGGDLSGNDFTGSNFQVTTDGGNVNVNALNAPATSIQSGGGDVTLTFTEVPANLQITADGGNVNVILPPGRAKYDISARGVGGNVNYSPALADPSSHDVIDVNSGGGDITITQAG